jgi:DNA-binding NtrC family response regulator
VEDRILIVDDEEVICSILARRLTREGYSCVTAHNGKEGLNHFYKDSFSLIISDIKMPEMDGIELLKKVKAMHPNMIVIMVTAYPEIDMAVEAMRLGAYDFIITSILMEQDIQMAWWEKASPWRRGSLLFQMLSMRWPA